jgi:alpha-glucosidase
MHGPEAARRVANLLKLRARLTPYLYDLLWRAHENHEPIVRPTFYDFPNDARCYAENDEMMIGAAILAAPIVAPAQVEREVYLPAGTGWFDLHSGEPYHGGDIYPVSARWGRPPLFARAGSAIAANLAEQHFNAPADERGFFVFPLMQGCFETSSFEDDGESFAYRGGFYREWKLAVESTADALAIAVSHEGCLPPASGRLSLILPPGENRRASLSGAKIVSDDLTQTGRTLSLALG